MRRRGEGVGSSVIIDLIMMSHEEQSLAGRIGWEEEGKERCEAEVNRAGTEARKKGEWKEKIESEASGCRMPRKQQKRGNVK